MIENLIFGKSGFNTSVFKEHFISYSCILFIKYYALRSFCIKLLCFSKNCIFQIFDRSNLLLDRSKMRLKFWFEPDRFDRCSIAFGSIECNFRSIKSYFRSIENRIESFLKPWVFTCSITFKLFQNTFLSLFDRSRSQSNFFCRFPSKFLQGFSLPRPVRPYCPSFFIYFQFSCINSCTVG